jgi:hypothetical protein
MDAQGERVDALQRQKGIQGPWQQTGAIFEETTTGRHGKCYQDLKNQRLDLAERSTTSKTL